MLSRKLRRCCTTEGDLTLAFVGSHSDHNGNLNATFTDAPIGTADSKRHVTLVIGTTVNVPTGVTIGGTSATLLESYDYNSATVSVWELKVATGTTATIVVTSPATGKKIKMGVYTITGKTNISSSAAYTDGGDNVNLSVVASADEGEILLGGVSHLDNLSGATIGWSNATEESDDYNDNFGLSTAWRVDSGATISAATGFSRENVAMLIARIK